MAYINAKEGDIPGTIIKDGVLYGELCGRYVPVIGIMWSQFQKCFVPVLDVPQMTDAQWMDLVQKSPVSA